MTGVLPIAKYSSGSELNMFVEYDMAISEKFSDYFGYLESDVDRLCDIYQHETENPKISREGLRIWYNGYHTALGNRLYNPRSIIVLALTDNQLCNISTYRKGCERMVENMPTDKQYEGQLIEEYSKLRRIKEIA